MSVRICCTQFKGDSTCVHPAAPKHWIGSSLCIEVIPHDTKDERIGKIYKCGVKIPIPKPVNPYP